MQTIAVCRAISSRFAPEKNRGPMSAPKTIDDEQQAEERARRVDPAPRASRGVLGARRVHHELMLGQLAPRAAAATSRPLRMTAMRSHRPSSSGQIAADQQHGAWPAIDDSDTSAIEQRVDLRLARRRRCRASARRAGARPRRGGAAGRRATFC